MHKQYICMRHYVCCVCIYMCVHFCVCLCVCIYTHTSTNYKYHQIFLGLSHDSIFYDMGASEVKPANLCICMTNFNQTQSFYKLPCHFRVSMLKKKKCHLTVLFFTVINCSDLIFSLLC